MTKMFFFLGCLHF